MCAAAHYSAVLFEENKPQSLKHPNSALPCYATYKSKKAKKAAVKAIAGERLGDVGKWLKRETRFENLCDSFKKLAHDIERKAPYSAVFADVASTKPTISSTVQTWSVNPASIVGITLKDL